MQQKVFIIGSQSLGKGDEQLGAMLMANFLRLLGENENQARSIIFWNSGVRLCCEGSKVLDYLKKLEEKGIEILACTTCLEYLGLAEKLKVGKPTTMVKSIESMFQYDVVAL